jgi:hypothetical protein
MYPDGLGWCASISMEISRAKALVRFPCCRAAWESGSGGDSNGHVQSARIFDHLLQPLVEARAKNSRKTSSLDFSDGNIENRFRPFVIAID